MSIITKLLNKYKSMPITVKAALWFVVCTLMQKCISFITIPLFTRLMSVDEYGSYSTYLSWYSILTVVSTMNIHTVVYVNQLTNAKTVQDRNKVAIPLISLSATVTVIVAGITLVISKSFNEYIGLSSTIIFHIFLQIFFQIPVNFWTMKQRHTYRYISLVWVTVAITLGNSLLGILFVWLFPENQALARVISISLVNAIVGGILYLYFVRTEKRVFSVKGWMHTLAVQLPVIPHGLSLSVLYSSDRIMISSILGKAEAGIYSLSYSVGYVVSMLKQCIADALRPWLLAKLKNGAYSQIRQDTKPVFMIVGFLSVAVTAFAPEIIHILAPVEYHDAIYGIPAVALSSVFGFYYSMFSIFSFYFEKTGKIMFVSISAAIINLILNAICIPTFGYMAAAYTTLICYLFLAATHYLLMRRVCIDALGHASLFDLKFIVLLSVVIILLSGMFLLLYKYTLIRYGFVLILGIAAYRNKNYFLDTIISIQKAKGD